LLDRLRGRVTEGLLTAVEPDPEEARSLVETGTERGWLVTLCGRCRVEYDGRAASTLEAGDRLVVLKSDGTVLVHTDEGQQPVNWQPPGCTHDVVVEEQLRIESSRETPDEQLLIRFERVVLASAYETSDQAELEVTGTEEDMRERILAEPELLEPGFEPRATERQTPAGAVDIYGTDEAGNVVVVELKRRRVGPDAVSQLDRYVTALAQDRHDETTVRGVLVAPSASDGARRLLENRGLEFVTVEPDGSRESR
jgi:RecB family endonuclease NucS